MNERDSGPVADSKFRHERIFVSQPALNGRETDYVMEAMASGWLTSHGRFVPDFEQAFADYCGVKHAIAVCNGTAALHLCVAAHDIGPGDEVIVPTLTYIATANAVRYCGATPIFVDNDPLTFNMLPEAVAASVTPRTKAIIPVHLYGQPVDMDPILDLAERHDLVVIEDAAEAVGARYRGRMTGGLGACAAFSFYANKIITTGEGGMITTSDDQLAARLRLLRGQGMDPDRRYFFPIIGYNYRMTNLSAAVGLAQMERIADHLEARRRVAQGYRNRLSSPDCPILLPHVESWAESVYWMYTIMLGPSAGRARDAVMSDLDRRGIETRPVFYPVHTMPPYADAESNVFPNAEQCAARGINLPTHGGLTEADLDRVCAALVSSAAGAD